MRRSVTAGAGALALAAAALVGFGIGNNRKPHPVPPTTTSPPPTTTVKSTTTVAPTTTSTSSTSTTTIPAGPPISIAACGTISQPGNYVVAADLNLADSADAILNPDLSFDCLTVRASQVTVDCAGHTITSWARSMHVAYASNVRVTGCTFPVTTTPRDGMLIEHSTDVRLDGDTFSGISVNATASQRVTTVNDSFPANGAVQYRQTTGSTITQNTFTGTTAFTGSTQILDLGGGHNTIDHNTLDGAGQYLNGKAVGFDDGIIIEDASGDLVTANTATHYWDATFETLGYVASMHVTNNSFSSASKAIGGWYWSSWVNNVVQGNTFANVNFAWYMFNDYGPPAGHGQIEFTGNQFLSNTVTSYMPPDQPAANIYFPVPNPNTVWLDPVTGSPYTPTATQMQSITSGNVLTGNNFTTGRTAPTWAPPTSDAVLDGGGNICGPLGSAVPLHCLTG